MNPKPVPLDGLLGGDGARLPRLAGLPTAQAELARSYGVSQSTISRLAAPGPFAVSAAGV